MQAKISAWAHSRISLAALATICVCAVGGCGVHERPGNGSQAKAADVAKDQCVTTLREGHSEGDVTQANGIGFYILDEAAVSRLRGTDWARLGVAPARRALCDLLQPLRTPPADYAGKGQYFASMLAYADEVRGVSPVLEDETEVLGDAAHKQLSLYQAPAPSDRRPAPKGADDPTVRTLGRWFRDDEGDDRVAGEAMLEGFRALERNRSQLSGKQLLLVAF